MKFPEQTRGIHPRVRDENPGVPKCHVHGPRQQGIQRHVTVRDSRKPRDTENRTFAAELFTRTQANRLRFSPTGFRHRTRSSTFFFLSGARLEGRRGDATGSIATRRREEKRHPTSYSLASYVFSRTTRDYPATTSFESGELGAFRSYSLLLGEFPGERQQRLVRARRAHQRDAQWC